MCKGVVCASLPKVGPKVDGWVKGGMRVIGFKAGGKGWSLGKHGTIK